MHFVTELKFAEEMQKISAHFIGHALRMFKDV
jgi:hypothetical protein